MDIGKLRRAVLPVLERYDVCRAALFGSVARGEDTRRSDIDVLIEFRGEKSLLDLSGLKLELEALLGRKVDVLTYDSLHPLLKERILREQVALL